MMRALWTAASGMMAQQLHVDTIANNIANSNTTGFKKSRIDFADLLYQNMRAAGGAAASATSRSPSGIQIGMGVQDVAVTKVFEQGALQDTSDPYNIAISGPGFFKVLLDNGQVAYTRDGAFKRSGEGKLVTSSGTALDPEIIVDPTAISVSVASDGTVSITRADGTAEDVGQIQLAIFTNPAGLQPIGQNMFLPTGASGSATDGNPSDEGFGTLNQGMLETSNVQIVEELTNLIIAQRAYETNSKAVQTADDMLSIANQLRR